MNLTDNHFPDGFLQITKIKKNRLIPDAEVSAVEMVLREVFAGRAKSSLAPSCSILRSHVVIFITHCSVYIFIGKHLISRIIYGGKPTMTKILPPKIAKVKYHTDICRRTGWFAF